MRRDFLPAVGGVEAALEAPARAARRPATNVGSRAGSLPRAPRELLLRSSPSTAAPADDHAAASSAARELDERVGGARGGAAGGANQRDLALRVEPFDLRRRQRPGGELGLDGRARDERDAVTGLDGAPHRLLQAELEAHIEVAQAQPQAAQLVLDDLADAGAFLHHDHVLAAQLVERDRASGEGVAGRAREDHLVVEERLEPGGTMPARRTDDAELELARGDALDHGLRVRDGQRDLHARVSALELAEQQRHDDRGRAGGRSELELAAELTLALAGELVEQLLLEREQPLRAAVEPQAGLGRLDAAAGAVEELRAEPLLQRAHLERDGRLRDTKALGGLREAAALDDCDRTPQVDACP